MNIRTIAEAISDKISKIGFVSNVYAHRGRKTDKKKIFISVYIGHDGEVNNHLANLVFYDDYIKITSLRSSSIKDVSLDYFDPYVVRKIISFIVNILHLWFPKHELSRLQSRPDLLDTLCKT